MFKKVAIIGPGLIGASMGLAMRERGLTDSVVGIGRRKVSLDKARAVGAIDKSTLDVTKGLKDADLVVLATPIGAFETLAPAIAESIRSEALLTDVASSKVKVIETVTSALRRRPDIAYIPTHPMAGSEQTGPDAARADLFEGATCIITPLTNTFPESKGSIVRLWKALGSEVVSMTPQIHDRLVARISHVPHLAAAALIAAVEGDDARLCGRGLLDTTRVASGSPDLWMDICKSNRTEVRRALADYIALLQQLESGLEDGDLGRVRAILESAKEKRDHLVHERRSAGLDQ